MTTQFTQRLHLPIPAAEVFAWHERPGAFQRLTPRWERFEVVSGGTGIRDGDMMTARVGVGPFSARWVARHSGYVAGREFTDEQVAGPFSRWVHRHRVTPDGPGAAVLEDHIDYALPLGPLGQALAGSPIRAKLERAFAFRHAMTAIDLSRHHKFAGAGKLTIAITGASGLVGSALVPFLTGGGHFVKILTRKKPDKPDESSIFWDPATGDIDAAALEGIDAVIHLAGENIAGRRWNAAQKAAILDSRVKGTQLIAATIAKLKRPPRVFISTSAVGYYGDHDDAEILDETAAPGDDFLADVCKQWEAATAPASAAGIRTVMMRVGVVLTAGGGALRKMLTPFKLGFGGKVGSGKQAMSWISLDDLIGAYHQALFDGSLSGPVNAVAPSPVTNRAFTKVLGAVLRRPTIAPLPGFMVKAMFGEMGKALLLGGARVLPARLLAAGFEFHHPTLETALRHELGRPAPATASAAASAPPA
ncbi:MAG: TIGR01777 family oxidoreductase [Deltaproteobacteria bacterium]|nr:TIGR01777 family oxidoreductase [Deltaproteobacteria bacterium]